MADCKRKTALLNDNPLCGISTYKDALNLATGACTRIISKYEFTGQENWVRTNSGYFYTGNAFSDYNNTQTLYQKLSSMFSHYIAAMNDTNGNSLSNGYACLYCSNSSPNNYHEVYIRDNGYSTANDFKAYLAQQYANGTPVTIWYVLAESTTETITVPSGLSGTEEGYLNQSGTPTPTNPIYPTANNVEVWQHSLRKLGTGIDTITTLPADIYADGTNATVGLKGNMSQTGTPTPDNPIQPQETGERTENLWNEDYTNISVDLTYVPIYVGDGQFTLSTSTPFSGGAANLFLLAGNVASGASTGANGVWDGVSRTVTAIDGYVTIVYRNATSNPEYFDTMLNSGSTPKPYEPYGYKIPISSANTTTPVYFGEVESTRKIKKLVLTGEENFDYYSVAQGSLFRMTLNNSPVKSQLSEMAKCSHYKVIIATNRTNMTLSGILTVGSSVTTMDFINNDYNNATEFKAHLADQYAAGTPVTVWYVLANEETAVVNEPLRKIGDYADTVNGITIPTITGADSFDVLTTLEPSEVELTYAGWHNAEVKEKSENLWNEDYTGIKIDIITYLPLNVGDGDYTLSSTATTEGQAAVLFLLAGNVSTGATTANNGVWNGRSRTVAAVNGYVTIGYRKYTEANPENANTMLNSGTTALPYEPYWK